MAGFCVSIYVNLCNTHIIQDKIPKPSLSDGSGSSVLKSVGAYVSSIDVATPKENQVISSPVIDDCMIGKFRGIPIFVVFAVDRQTMKVKSAK